MKDEILQEQFAGCEQPMVPCFACNRHGIKHLDYDYNDLELQIYCNYEGTLPSFWTYTQFPGEKRKKLSYAPPSTIAPACGCNNGWWCRSNLNFEAKCKLLVDNGFTEHEAKVIYNEQAANDANDGGWKTWVPCYLCNRTGASLPKCISQAVVPHFWQEFSLEEAMKQETTSPTDIDNPCHACSKLKGWWFRGSELSEPRRIALVNAGCTPAVIDKVMKYQAGSERDPLLPCYLCNKMGKLIGLPNKRKLRDPFHWRYLTGLNGDVGAGEASSTSAHSSTLKEPNSDSTEANLVSATEDAPAAAENCKGDITNDQAIVSPSSASEHEAVTNRCTTM
jgi:hypothetical protein